MTSEQKWNILLRHPLSVDEPTHSIILEIGRESGMNRLHCILKSVDRSIDRIRDRDIWQRIFLVVYWLILVLLRLEKVDNFPKNPARSRRSTDSLHIFSIFIADPDRDQIVLCEADRPVITEISRCPSLYEDETIWKIQNRIDRKTSDFRVSIGENRYDHIDILRIGACDT